MKAYLVQWFLNRLCFYGDKSCRFPQKVICLTPPVWAFPFCFKESPGSRWLQFPETPEKQQYCIVHSTQFHKRCRTEPLNKTACPECRHSQPESDTTLASLGSAQSLPLERCWAYSYYTSWVSRGLVKIPESNTLHIRSSKGCVQTFTMQTDMWSQNYVNLNCLLCPSTKNSQISSP